MATRIGARLKAVREKLGYTRSLVAQRAGIDAAMLFRIENSANSAPTFETIRKVADVLEISLDWLAGSSRPPAVSEMRLAEVQRTQQIRRARSLLEQAMAELSEEPAIVKKAATRKRS